MGSLTWIRRARHEDHDAVAFKHFKGFWFTVGVERGILEQVTIPKSLGEQLDALCAKKE